MLITESEQTDYLKKLEVKTILVKLMKWVKNGSRKIPLPRSQYPSFAGKNDDSFVDLVRLLIICPIFICDFCTRKETIFIIKDYPNHWTLINETELNNNLKTLEVESFQGKQVKTLVAETDVIFIARLLTNVGCRI
ncbi:uncharacterized protein LOC142354481 isoform X1 [Convolutriloba macropyga]|uniref:uncharacterized protein LOC142354481 isoform X1 n=1 Tax=Convolutriloba macropyga TaxID=536237 RepID=UPI003F51B964